MTVDEEKQVLRDLVESDGWRLYMEQMSRAWGHEAFEQALEKELGDAMNESRDPVPSSTMLHTFKGVRASLKWPEERLRQLTDGKQARGKQPLSALHAMFQKGAVQ